MLSLPEIDDAIRAAETRHRAELDWLYELRSQAVAEDYKAENASLEWLTRKDIAARLQRHATAGALRRRLERIEAIDPVEIRHRAPGGPRIYPFEWLVRNDVVPR